MSLNNRIIELYRNDRSLSSKIFLMLNELKTNFEIVGRSPNRNLIFVNQMGGEIASHIVKNAKYYYNVEYAKPINIKYSSDEVYLLTVNDGSQKLYKIV